MSAQSYLLIGNIIVWLGIAGYLLVLGAGLTRVSRRLERLAALRGEDVDG